MIKVWYKSTTLWVAAAEIVLGSVLAGLQAYQGGENINACIVLIVTGIITGALRFITTIPIGRLPK